MKPILKFYRFEHNKVILIPTAEGADYLGKNKVLLKSDKSPLPIPFEKGSDTVGDKVILAYVATLQSTVIHNTIENSIILNYTKVRIFTGGQINYFLQLPFGVEPQQKNAEDTIVASGAK